MLCSPPLFRDNGSGRSQFLFAVVLFVLTVAAYAPVWNAGFVWDDDMHLKPDYLQSTHVLSLIWFKPGFMPQYYPLTHTIFWLEGRLWGLQPLGYHVVNVVLHAVSAVLLWRVLRLLTFPGAKIVSMLFALHPVNVESVAWVSELKNCLSGLFYFIAALCWLKAALGKERKASKSVWFIAALLAFAAALLSKTVTGSLPGALALAIYWKRQHWSWPIVATLAAMLLMAVVAGRETAWLEIHHVGASGPDWDLGFAQRTLIAGASLSHYLLKLLLPIGLNFNYPRWTLIGPMAIFPALWFVLMLGLFLAQPRLGRGPLCAALLFIGTLLPAIGFADVYPMRYSFVADHFVYLAGIGLFCVLAAALDRLPWIALIVCLSLAVLTFRRAQTFRDSQRLWSDALAKNPSSWIACDQLGTLGIDTDPQRALDYFKQSIRLHPHQSEAFLSLAALDQKQDRPREALIHLHEAVDAEPLRVQPRLSLGIALLQMNQLPAAVAALQSAIRINPDFIPAYQRLAEAYDKLNRPADALHARQEVQRLFQQAFGYDGSTSKAGTSRQ